MNVPADILDLAETVFVKLVLSGSRLEGYSRLNAFQARLSALAATA